MVTADEWNQQQRSQRNQVRTTRAVKLLFLRRGKDREDKKTTNATPWSRRLRHEQSNARNVKHSDER